MVFARLPSVGDRRLLTRLAKLRLDNRPHLVAGKIRIHCFMSRSDPILGDYFFIHRPGNGIQRLGVRRRCWLERSLLWRRIRDESRISLPRGRDGLCSRLCRRMEGGYCRYEHDDRDRDFSHGSLRIGGTGQDQCFASDISFSGADGRPQQNWIRLATRIFSRLRRISMASPRDRYDPESGSATNDANSRFRDRPYCE